MLEETHLNAINDKTFGVYLKNDAIKHNLVTLS